MSSKIRNVALLLPAFVLATGLASAQSSVKVSTINPDGSVTSNNLTPTSNGPGAKAPTPAADGSAKYWDALGIGGTSTNYFSQVPYLIAPPNPQIAAGPDDILTIVNRTISRWPNPNAAGNTGTLNPYNYPPTEYVPLDVWMGLTVLGTQAGGGALCPSGTGNNSNCVIDNASIRYDQMQGRFIVLFTVTDMPAHRSNWVLVVSTFSQFQKCPVPAPAGSVCPTSSPLFTPPVIAPIVGGTQTGGQNAANWVLYKIPINLLYNVNQNPSALGLVNGNGVTGIPPFNNPLANSAVGTPNTIATGGQTATFLTTPFCPNGGPNLPLTYGSGNGTAGTGTAGGTGRSCTNYFPTGARFGIDNDNIILSAPVLDQAFAANEGNFPSGGGQSQGPYAGTRVTTIAKIAVYNGTGLNLSQPPSCLGDTPIDCQAVNLSDDTATGTLSVVNQKIAFGQGATKGLGLPNGDLQYGGAVPNSCITTQPAAVVPTPLIAVPPASNTPSQAVLSCAPLATLTTALPAVFWEPDNLRGRALASFDAQVAPFTTPQAGVITPIDYIVGTEITDNFGAGLKPQGTPGVSGQGATSVTVTVTAFTVGAGSQTVTVSPADAAKLTLGMVSLANSGTPTITAIDLVGGVITLTAQGVPTGTGVPTLLTFGTSFSPGSPFTAGIATKYYIQPIAFSCPATSGLISDFTNCFQGAPGGQSVVADVPILGTLRVNVSTLAQVADPAPVGQGFSAAQMTTNPLVTPVSPTTNSRIFVGDSRPEQVMFREGLLYIARSVRLADLNPVSPSNWLGTSTVLYDIIKTCAATTSLGLPLCGGGYSITGGNITAPALAFEYEWFNGLNVPDPNGDINGFGFYTPMFESPADVVSSGPIAPISTLQLFDKLFVGMTTGGTNNTAALFSKNYPSLWDWRSGDDAFDTAEPYLDPYTGVVNTTYQCGSDLTVTILSKSGNTITVADPSGLGAGMYLTGTQTQIQSISGNVITLSAAFSGSTFPANATFSRIQPIVSVTATLVTPGSNQITVTSTNGLAIGQILASGGSPSAGGSTSAGSVNTTAYTCTGGICPPNVAASNTSFGITVLTNVGFGEKITGNQTGNVSALSGTTQGSIVITVPNSAQVAPGMSVTGCGVASGSKIATAGNPIFVNPDGTLQITLSAPEATTVAGPCNVKFDSTPCFSGANFVTGTTNASQFVVNSVNVPGISNLSGTVGTATTCTSFYADGTNGSTTGQTGAQVAAALNGNVLNRGIPVTFTAQVGQASPSFFGSGLTIINIVGNVVTLSGNANAPLPGLNAAQTSTNVPFNFQTTSTSANAVQCQIIPWSQHGGASTDPNDGSLWLFGEFAKFRLSTIPGPGQWGTSLANYALSFPATDAYGNDNTYFQDVQPTGSPDSGFFTWIQLAKNLGLAVPSATGPCTINNGLPPILTPPAPGTLPNPSPSNLGCPYFGPDTIVTRAEMAYWVVKAFMDEFQITNYLCATGGDPSGLSPQCSASLPASSFADLGAGGGSILNPFLGANPALGIAGVTNAQLMRYIEVMARRGITKGCNNTTDPQAAYCPNQPVTRAQMAVFLIRAKMDNVFPTTLSGIPLASPYGDNFGNYLPPVPYFSDVTASDPVFGQYYIYIQKMRELRITNGTGGVTYSPGNNLTRKEIATFIVRAFFL